MRGEDKEERRGLGEGSHFVLEISARGEGEEEENWENRWFWKLSQGTVVAGNFGLGGQETTRIPGAREPERLFLVGWEVNIQLGSLGKLKNKRTRD
jgi:hypothetical protein